MDEDAEPKPVRGTALLVITIIIIAVSVGYVVLPRNGPAPDLRVRVAIVDSGITKDEELLTRVVAEASFINSSYGYQTADNSTEDSQPNGNPHGTYVAKILSQEAPDAAIINAKVVTTSNTATIEGIISAIQWAVEDENCSVINISLGTLPTTENGLGNIVKWAFERGVSIVAAAGNNGMGGAVGTSIESPAVYPEVIAVGAADNIGGLFDFSGRGPLWDRTIKPDICASGFYSENGVTVFGTSYATPVVSAAAIGIIEFCEENDLSWTPGMIKATLLASAIEIPREAWEAGAGLVDLDQALNLVEDSLGIQELPLIAAISPTSGPFSFERWFVNSTAHVSASVFCSDVATFAILYTGSASEWVTGPRNITLDQRGAFHFDIRVVTNVTLNDTSLEVALISPGYSNLRARFTFDVATPQARIAFDFSHSPWLIDSIYGQFRGLYELITQAGIAVEEFRSPQEILAKNLTQYDAIFVVDPCAWDYSQIDNEDTPTRVFSYSPAEIATYTDYWNAGGSLLIIGLGNSSLDLLSANELLAPFGFQLNYDQIPAVTIVVNGISSTHLITDIEEHNATSGIDSFDFNGCSVNYTGAAYSLAQTEVSFLLTNGSLSLKNRTVVAALEGAGGGRIIVSGSNFLFDNWGIRGSYQSTQNAPFALQITRWLTGII
ncbi:MAG: S8 family serine peptidase [Candidatus Thorarchaeota archaeon]